MEITFALARSLVPAMEPQSNQQITHIADPPDLLADVRTKGSGFFDVANPALPLGNIDLVRAIIDGEEQFLLNTRLAYRDRMLGVILVPGRDGVLQTDLASIPQIFSWLVPKTGTLLPAALIHDGLTPPPDNTYVGPAVEQSDADRVLRDAMRDLGTGWIQRWLVWTAVAMATEFKSGIRNHAWKTLPGIAIVLR